MTKRQKFFSALGQFFKNVFTKNILLKVVALVFALLLWGYVLSEVKPKYVKRIYDVEITLQNEEKLKQKGWVVADHETYLTDVNVEAEIDKHSMLDASHVKCYVDLEKIQITDQDQDRKTVTLDVTTTIPEYGALKSVSVEQIELTIERTWTGNALTATVRTENSLPAVVQVGSSLPEYFECIPPKTVTIPPLSGLKSEIDQISRAEATIDLASFENTDLSAVPGTYSLIVPVTFYDLNGEVVDNATTRDVKVTVDDIEIRRYKEVPVELNVVKDNSFDGETYEYECSFADEGEQTIRIYGSAADLAKINSIRTDEIVLTSEEREETLSVGLSIPDGVKTERKKTVSVDVAVRTRMTENTSVEVPISYVGTGVGLVLADRQETLEVLVSGKVDDMRAFDAKWITASVDLKGCGQGTHTLPITIEFKGAALHVQDYRVEQTDNADEPIIRITFAGTDGSIYVIELPQKTVTIRLQTVENGSPE